MFKYLYLLLLLNILGSCLIFVGFISFVKILSNIIWSLYSLLGLCWSTCGWSVPPGPADGPRPHGTLPSPQAPSPHADYLASLLTRSILCNILYTWPREVVSRESGRRECYLLGISLMVRGICQTLYMASIPNVFYGVDL